MKKDAHDKYKELSSQSAVSRALHSIRTRYSLATAFFLLLSLLVFYIGGRIVLVHMMREAERQVEEIGYDISRLAYSQAEAVARDCRKSTADIARLVASGEHPSMVLSRPTPRTFPNGWGRSATNVRRPSALSCCAGGRTMCSGASPTTRGGLASSPARRSARQCSLRASTTDSPALKSAS